jgi:RNA polymerase sigma-70 factor (ECF subfamily)
MTTNNNDHALVAEIPRLRRYARALVGDRAAADDLVQDTLERAWSRAAQWRPGSDLRAWLFGIMHNLRIDQLRRPSLSFASHDDEDNKDIEVPTRPTQTDRMELKDLADAVGRLPEEQRSVLLLVTLEEMRYEDVARTLNIPIGTVMSRLSRARERLRQMLDDPTSFPGLRVVK